MTTHTKARPAHRPQWFGWLCLAPYLILLLAFGIGPAGYAVYESFADPQGVGPAGGDAYLRVFSDFRFLPALGNVALFMALYLPVMVIGVLLLALVVQEQRPAYGAGLRLVYMLPGAVTGSASVLLWYVMLQPSLSPFGPALNAMGQKTGTDVFQQSHLVVIFALMAFATGFGQWVVIMYGALQGVPRELLEAARVDGASWWQTAWRVKLPLISKYVVYMLILAFTSGLQIFIEPQLLYGIAFVGSRTWSLNQLGLVFAFDNGDFSAAAALCLMMLAVCATGAALLVTRAKFFDTEVD
ncbi:carbohydrate ABC transporter permease [Kitasatospora sp. NPDC096147]|uniref:carbohydrate ABC transporter permease n=1 Tax=Kitasatospora sp. NPDC096147 TaxID=3364093 RepID=UPI0038141054